MTNALIAAIEDIEHALDATHSNAAQLIIEASRSHLAQHNFSRHTFHIKVNPGPGLIVKAGRLSRPWWELSNCPPESAAGTILVLGAMLDNLPNAVRDKLDGITL